MLHARERGELQSLPERAVAPADSAVVLGVGVLCVVDEQVYPLRDAIAGGPIPAQGEILDTERRLMVGHVGHAPLRARDAVAHSGIGVADERRADAEIAHVHLFAGHFVELEGAFQVAQTYREAREKFLAATERYGAKAGAGSRA